MHKKSAEFRQQKQGRSSNSDVINSCDEFMLSSCCQGQAGQQFFVYAPYSVPWCFWLSDPGVPRLRGKFFIIFYLFLLFLSGIVFQVQFLAVTFVMCSMIRVGGTRILDECSSLVFQMWIAPERCHIFGVIGVSDLCSSIRPVPAPLR